MKLNNRERKNWLTKIAIVAVFAGSVILAACEKDQQYLPPVNASGCSDTNNVSFSGFVKPLLDAQCVKCHGSSNNYGANLTDYDNIKTVASSGMLVSKIQGTMRDYMGTSDVDCKIIKISAWVHQGMKNN